MAAKQRSSRANPTNGAVSKPELLVKPHRISKSKKKLPLLSFISPQTRQACIVLALAIVTSVLYNHLHAVYNTDPNVKSFLETICNEPDVTCHPYLVPSKRTQLATKNIAPDEVVLSLPRRLQIWDLDAVQDEELQSQLSSTNSSVVYLVTYIAKARRGANETSKLEPILQHYLSILPTYDDFAAYHPVLWSNEQLGRLKHTVAYDYIMAFRNLIDEEYQFVQHILSRQDYVAARLAVQSRAFGTGPILRDRSLKESPYAHMIDFENCVAMVPVLDLYDHHARPNVDFGYHGDGGAFVIRSLGIPAGYEVRDSYGKRTEADLLARYGFLNGDGSEHSEASIAVFHSLDPLINTDVKGDQLTTEQRMNFFKYLQYDDGYEECVTPDGNPHGFELKKLKYEYLRKTSMKHWVARLAPRNRAAKPLSTVDQVIVDPPSFTTANVQANLTSIFGTCRVLVLVHTDYDGDAVNMLRDQVSDLNLALPVTNDALEFRTLSCVVRLAATALDRLGGNLAQQYDRVAKISRESYQSPEWTIQSAILSEMQGLDVLLKFALSKLDASFKDIPRDSRKQTPPFSMRQSECPKKNMQPLIAAVLR